MYSILYVHEEEVDVVLMLAMKIIKGRIRRRTIRARIKTRITEKMRKADE